MPTSKGRGVARLIEALRQAYDDRAAGHPPPLDGATLTAYLDGTLSAPQRDALHARLLAEPAACRQVADALRQRDGAVVVQRALPGSLAVSQLVDWLAEADLAPADRRRWRQRLDEGLWLGCRRVVLPSGSVSFASDAEAPFSHRVPLDDGVTLDLVEEPGGQLAVHLHTPDAELAGRQVVILLTPTSGGEPLQVAVDVVDLGQAGAGGHAVVGPIGEVLARLGERPEVAALAGGT